MTDYLTLIQANNLQADPVDPQDYLWVDKPWLECPPTVSLQADLMNIENQQRIGSCVSNAMTSICEALKKSVKQQPDALSRLYHYYRGRELSPTTHGKDGGMTLKQGLQAAKAWGICREPLWPYDPSKWDVIPSPVADADAALNKVTRYERLKGISTSEDLLLTIRRIKEALTLGYPVLYGFRVEQDFFNLVGPVPHKYMGMGKPGAVEVGAHAMVATGYYQRGATDYLHGANSWGTQWGDEGMFGIPLVTAAQDAIDIWCVTEFDGASHPNAETQHLNTQIARAYVALFGRAPDAEGLAFWTGLLRSGKDVLDWMFWTQPAQDYYATAYTTEQIVWTFYMNVLGRAPEPSAQQYWTDQAKQNGLGVTLASLIYTTANYPGTDPYGAQSCDRFNRRVRAARLYAEQGGTVEGSDFIRFIE